MQTQIESLKQQLRAGLQWHPLAAPTSFWQRIMTRWHDVSLGTKGVVLNALPLMVLLASIALIFESEQQAAALEKRVQNALQIQQDIQTLQTELLEASTGVRDFLLTGNRQFLVGYQTAKQAMPQVLDALAMRIEDRLQKQRLQVVYPLLRQNFEDLDALASNTANEANAALIAKFESQGNALNQLRNHLTRMSQRESYIITQDKIDVEQARQRNLQITLLAVLVGVLGSLMGLWIFYKAIVSRVRHIRDSAIHLVRGEPLALPTISRDELGQLTEELEHASSLLAASAEAAHQARIAAEEASAAKSGFLSRTSHELRTPLNAILGFAQILENDLPAGRQKDSASLIFNAGQHLLKLINEVLDISRIERGDMVLSMETIALNPLLEEAYHYIKPLGQVRDILIETDFSPDVYVRADRQRLLQVILNILGNALKYGPENATVRFVSKINAHRIQIEVHDEGRGIAPELRSRLFTPFDRLGAERTMTEGTGLGLVLSKQLMSAMGGDIGLATDKSMFWVALDIVTPETDTQGSYASPPVSLSEQHTTQSNPVSKVEKKQLLYVEDNASSRALMEAIMRHHRNYKLHTAVSLKTALIWLRDMRPDAIIIDLHLPDGSGEQLVAHVHSQPELAKIPILIMSADALPSTIARMQALGIQQYFTKPLNVADFNDCLRKLFA